MVLENTLKNLIEEHQQIYSSHEEIEREVSVQTLSSRVIIITGIRRCGKSTLMRQLFPENEALYINFEDPRLETFEPNDFVKIERIGKEKGVSNFLFDEIQNVQGWEKAIRIMNEKKNPVFISGSNASMLSKELGTVLTGRYKQIELFPFSYKEYLKLKQIPANVESLDKFIFDGGFPEYLLEGDPDYLRTLLRDIITRDIAVRRGIRNEQYLIRLAVHLLSNIGKEFSYNNITNILEIKSVRTTIDFCDYLEQSYLVESVPLFSWSVKKQIANPKKIYCIDNALAKANSLSFSKDYGRMLENCIFLQLRRIYSKIFYYKNRKTNAECDFLVKEQEQIIQAIQVCYEITEENKQREINGLLLAMKESNCTIGIIITRHQEDSIDGIEILPAWKWLLNN